MSKENQVNLSKQTLPQLQELLERQNALLRNKRILQQLKDKGESIRKLHGKITDEIKHRQTLESVQETLAALTISTDDSTKNEFLNEKHVGYVCSKDKPINDSRYRPHRTLVHQKENKPLSESLPNRFVEITAAFEPKMQYEPTKFIPLAESLVIENEQVINVMEERARRTLNNLHDIVNDCESDNDDDDPTTQPFEKSDNEEEVLHEVCA